MNINIQGLGSLNDGSPYIIIDGFPGEMDRLNPNDIESAFGGVRRLRNDRYTFVMQRNNEGKETGSYYSIIKLILFN